MKSATWNVNGIRAASKQGFLDWLSAENPEIVCLQEVKATPEQLDSSILSPKGYKSFWNSAVKLGYSGVATYCKKEPDSVVLGFPIKKEYSAAKKLAIEEMNNEGRVISTVFGSIVWINAYFPNSQREGVRLGFKLQFCKAMQDYCLEWNKKGYSTVLCGDYNIAHTENDLANPKSNMKNAGFLPEERAWMTEFLEAGFIDTHREFYTGNGQYSWWSYRPGVREKNVGWRLDYHCVSQDLKSRLKRTVICSEVKGSDHCPVLLELL